MSHSAIQSRLVEELVAELGDVDDLTAEPTWQRAERRTIDMIADMEARGELPKHIDQDTLLKEVLNEALALGPLEELLADRHVYSIAIHAYDVIMTGDRQREAVFSSNAAYQRCLARLYTENILDHVIQRRGNTVLIEKMPETPEPPDRPPNP